MKTENLNYIRQFLKETQLNYSLIYPTITDVLIHLLFVNGNGYNFIDGNPYCDLSYNRAVSFTEYYKEQKSFESCREYYYDYYLDRKVAENVQRSKAYNFENLSDDELYEKEYQSAWELIDKLPDIDILTDNTLLDIDFHYNNMKTKYVYRLSKDYYKICKMSENTEQNLLKLTIVILGASIKYFSDICDNTIKIIPDEFDIPLDKNKEDIIRLNDIVLMKADIIRLECYLK